MSSSSPSKVLVAQGGGPTAVINQSMVGVVLESRKFHHVEKVFGAFHGVRGIVNEDLVDLTQETTHNLEMVAGTPSSALGSTRDKPDLKYCHDIFRTLRAHGIGYFFYIGGNDSAETVRIVSAEARAASYGLRCIHIPKTVDNDVMANDHTPGFPSAARGKKFPEDGPHLIYIPERPFEIDSFLGDVKVNMNRYGRCVIAVSEGIADSHATPVATRIAGRVESDSHGNAFLGGGVLADMLTNEIKNKLGFKRVRGDTFGYLQRSFVGCVSDVDEREAREVGEKAVQFAMWGDSDGSVTIKRTGFYSVNYELTPLEEVTGKTRTMPDEFIAASGTDVTDAFRLYLRPLLGKNMPDVHRLRRNAVPKILKVS